MPTYTFNGISVDEDLVQDLKKSVKNPLSSSVDRMPAYTPVNNKDINNIEAGTGTGESLLRGIGFEPIPNPMSSVFQPSYHFSFYLDGDLPSEQGKGTEFIIAETGLSGMNIQEVNIDAIVGPNQRTKNAMATNIVIRIYEPFGAMLPDLLYQAAVTKGIRNYLKAPWFLKLTLHGYDEQGKIIQIGDQWTWQIMLIDVQSQINETGAMHTVTAFPYSEQALNDQYCMLVQGANASGTTVGDALKKVIEGMNNAVTTRYGASSTPFLEFEVAEEPYPIDTKVGVTSPFQNPITSSVPTLGNQVNNESFDVETGHFGSGTDFPAVVDMIMSKSETAVKMCRPSRELPPASGDDNETEIKSVACIAHRVDTKVEFKDYDYIQGDYKKKITYIIKPYITMRLITSLGRGLKFDKEKTFNREKARFAVEQSFLKKQYDYIFTGLNTEIEKFDISVNFNWAVQVPSFDGRLTNGGSTAQVDNGSSVFTLKQKLADTQSAVEEANSKLNDLKQSEQAAIDADPNSETAKGLTKTRQDLEAQIAALKNAQTQQATSFGKLSDKYNQQMKDQQAAQLARRPVVTGRITDGEDIVYSNAQGTEYQGGSQGASSYLPITIIQDANDPSLRTKTGMANDNSPNKSVYGALLNQLYGTMDGNLVSIELEVRGDPYWLGPGDSGQPFNSPSTDDRPNFQNGEHMFLFRFKLPLGYDDKTGTVALSTGAQVGTNAAKQSAGDNASTSAGIGMDSNIFTGFYSCIEVNNKFQDGKFTQVLKAVRIPGWEYENIIEGRESAIPDDTTYNNDAGPSSPAISNRATRPSSGGGVVETGNSDERTLLAAAMVGEAGGEGTKGMQAVGNVIMNRAAIGYRGNTVTQVITANKQFSILNNTTPAALIAKSKRSSSYAAAYELAGKLLSGQASDVTGGATHYLNRRTATDHSWENLGTVTTVIGNHTFIKGVK